MAQEILELDIESRPVGSIRCGPPAPLGSYEIVNGDSFTWLASASANSVQAVVTDPPYGLIEYTPRELEKLRRGQGGVWRIPPSFDGHQRKPLPRFTVLTGGLRRISATEPFKDLIYSAPARGVEREIAPHPSLKPQSFLRQIVRAALPFGGGVILDPFMGSGSTIAAASAHGLRSIGIETDADYFDLASRAIPDLTRYVPLAGPGGYDKRRTECQDREGVNG
ncbi:MAG: DNA methyltransferase [Chloroflexota bacterium]